MRALLQYFSTSPSGTKCKIAVKEDYWQRAHTLTIMSQEHAHGPRVFPLAELLARVHTVPGVQLMSCHACGWFIKGNTTQTVPGTAQEPARDARA